MFSLKCYCINVNYQTLQILLVFKMQDAVTKKLKFWKNQFLIQEIGDVLDCE